MLTIETKHANHSCDGMSRRSFLRIGSLGMAGLSLADLFALNAHAGTADFLRDKSVVFLYLAGGPSQIETFDPKMDAPVEMRSMTGECQTRLPGITFGATFPKLAARADRLAIVRSFVHGNTGHDGGKKLFGISGTGLSATYARLLGQTNDRTGMLSTAFISPQSVGFDSNGMLKRHFGFFYSGISQTGGLSSSNAPIHVMTNAQSQNDSRNKPKSGLLADMKLNLPLERLENRRELLRHLDGLNRTLDSDSSQQAMTDHERQALDVLRRGIHHAFDLSREDPRTIAGYDTSGFQTPQKLISNEKNGKMSAQSQSVIGRQLLLARRLCEAGCRFITVGMNDWDMHGNHNSFPIPVGMKVMGGALDHAVTTFLDDLKERGLSEKVLLVMTGEMGRTPRITVDKSTKNPGRNHWGRLGALALAGGGLKMGQVIGQSDRTGGEPAADPVRPANLMATITHTLFDVGKLRLKSGLPTELIQALSTADPIRNLS